MDAARYARLKQLVFAASRLHGPDRALFLDRECAGDPALRDEVTALLSDDVPTANALGFGADTTNPGAGRDTARVEIPQKLGAYRLGSELGRGGMGIVYEATDERTGEPVAVKLLHPTLLRGEEAVERFMREARIGASIAHGGIVRTLDAGRDASSGHELHWLVMERVVGRTLRRLLQDLGTVPERLAREIALQCAAALAAIHAAGIVHRDLKPENILITDDQRVRIMDLGIAKARAESVTLTREGQFLGSVSHAAPEQIEGRDAGPAADLYALGVTLHELVTGTNPFLRDGVGATLRAQLEVTPPPPPGVTPFLAQVVATLLEKIPERRFRSAAELQRVLAEGEDSAWWQQRRVQRRSRRTSIAPRTTALVGREAETDALAAAWQQARDGRGSVVVIEGEAGIGKTRLLGEIADMAERDEALVVAAIARAGEGAWTLGAALSLALGPEVEDSVRETLAGSPALASVLAAFAGGDQVPPGATADALAAAFARWLVAHSQRQPVLLIVDDAHEADREAAPVVRALARAASSAKAVVVVAGRTDVARAWAPPLLAAPGARHVVPERLQRGHLVQIVDEMLGNYEIALRLGPRLMQLTDGVPGFALELLKGLRERGALTRGEGGDWHLDDETAELDLPAAARDSVSARLALLERDARELLDAAAVHGPVFDAALVAEQLDRPLVRVLQDLADLERRHALVRSEGRLHAFDCTLLREVLLDELPEPLARVHHARLAEALRRRLPPLRAPDGRQSAEIVAHGLRGADPDAVAPFVRAALEHASARNQHAEVVELADLALQLAALPPEARVVALTLRARSLSVMGKTSEQDAACAQAVAEAERLGDPVLLAGAVLAQAMQSWARGDIDAAASAFEMAAMLSRQAGDEPAELRAARNLATAMARQGRLDDAVALHEWCKARAAAIGDMLTQAMSTNNLGAVHVTRGEHALARARFAEAIGLARAAADVRIEAHAEGGVGLADLHLGKHEEAMGHALRQAELGREIGDRRSELLGLSTAGLAAMARGRLDDALSLIARSVEVAEATGDRRGRAFVLGHLSEVKALTGAFDAAREAAAAGLEQARQVGHQDVIAHLLSRLVRIAEAEGADEEVLERSSEAMSLLHDAGSADLRANLHVSRAQALEHLSRTPEAMAELDEASRLLEGREHPALETAVAFARARIGKQDPAPALALLARHEARMSVSERLASRHAAFGLTGDAAHLAEAHRLVEHLRQNAPAARRDAIVADVPLFASVARAWAESLRR